MGVQTNPGKTGLPDNEPSGVYNFGANIPAANSTTAVAAAQQLAGAGNFVLAATPYVAGFDGGRLITISSAGAFSGRTFTLTGTDKDGLAQTETMAGPANGTVTSTKYYQTISSVAVDGALATNTSVGFSSSLVVLFLYRGNHFKLNPANSTAVKLAIYGENTGAVKNKCSLTMVNPATLTLTFADGTTPSDSRIYFAAGTEPTPTASGTDVYEFSNDETQASGDDVWFAESVTQDLKP